MTKQALLIISLFCSLFLFGGDVTAKMDAKTMEIMQKAADELATSDIIERSAKTGDKAIDFSLPDVSGKDVGLYDLLKTNKVVLTFYRGGWCPICNMQLKQLQDVLPDIENAGAKLVAISPETPDNSITTAQKNKLKFYVLSDVGNKVAKEYGIVFKLADELLPIYKNFGIDLKKYNGNDKNEIPIPATYVIDRDGTIIYAFKKTDYKLRADPKDILAALK